MAISSCPMCQTSIPSGEIVETCHACGADLSRWVTKEAAPPTLIQPVGHGTQSVAQESAEDGLGMGFAGAVLGACIGSGLLYGFHQMIGFRFPLLAVSIGFLTGLLAKKFHKGADDRLGLAAGILSMAGVVGTLYLIYGTFPMLSIVSVVLSASLAYRMASN